MSEYLSFLDWNKTYYGQIQDRVNKIEPQYRMFDILLMYREYIRMYLLNDEHFSNCDYVFKSYLFHEITNNPSFDFQIHRLDKLIKLIIEGSKPITDHDLIASNRMYASDWDVIMATGDDGKCCIDALIKRWGLREIHGF